MSKPKTTSTNVYRLLLEVTFTPSGCVETIDPLGTQYRIEGYLEALARQSMIPDQMTLGASVILSALEFCLGVFILLAVRRRVVLKIVLVFMAIMAVMMLWLAIANPTSDCGCFGDAIKLSNTEILLKNIVLLGYAIILTTWPTRMWRLISRPNQWIILNYAIFFVIVSSLYCLYKLSLFGFRPYHVGVGIQQGVVIPEGAE